MEAPETHDPNNIAAELARPQNLHLTPHPILPDPRRDPRIEQSIGKHELDNLSTRIPDTSAGMSAAATIPEDDESVKMNCCCGRSDCAYLEHNRAALGGLEKNLDTAARLGQALLLRHESYVNESQAERARLSTCVSDLEAERESLQTANEKITAENKELSHQLDYLNASLNDSDRDVKRLEKLLADCESEVKRLNMLVRRTQELDTRLEEMERDRELLDKQMEEGHLETQCMLTRWRESERRVRELEEDVQRIEREARMDREEHEEIVARLEKEKVLDRELSSAEGRLKGAAALQSMDKDGKDSKNVVSHFVKDILQDNANLQSGIEELRQLLQASNEEVENLREQLLLHQPIMSSGSGHRSQRSVSLDQELSPEIPSPRQLQREVHVHHHYHTKPGKGRVTANRKPTKRRSVVSGYGDASDSSLPSTPVSRMHRYNSSPAVPLTLQKPQSNRWSMQSTATMSSILSSIPSSPRSYFDRGGSMFDRLERGEESSRPTSPESMGGLLSPGPGQWRFKHDATDPDEREEEEIEKQAFEMSPLMESMPSLESDHLPIVLEKESPDVDRELTPKPSTMLQITPNEAGDKGEAEPSPTPQEEESSFDTHQEVPRSTHQEGASISIPHEEKHNLTPRAPTLSRKASRAILDIPEIRPSLARKGSHETLVSISGMDIHIAQRPSPTSTLELLHSHFAHSPSQARKASAVQPVASVTEYTAISSSISALRPNNKMNQSQLPSSIEALSGIAVPKPRMARSTSQTGTIGRLGGWVRGRWGVAPTKSVGNLRSVSLGQEAPSLPTLSSQTNGLLESQNREPEVDSTAEVSGNTTPVPVRNRPGPAPLHAKVDPMILFAGRSPGVNQSGMIPGFRAAVMSKRTPSQVMTSVIDEEGLQEGLAEL